jgi:hypothetical protein
MRYWLPGFSFTSTVGEEQRRITPAIKFLTA